MALSSFHTAGGDFYCYYLRAVMQTDAFSAGDIQVSNTNATVHIHTHPASFVSTHKHMHN